MGIEYAVTMQIGASRVSATLDGTPSGYGKLRGSVAYDHSLDGEANAVAAISKVAEKLSEAAKLDLTFSVRGVAQIENGYVAIIMARGFSEGAQ